MLVIFLLFFFFKLAILSTVAGFISLYELLFSSQPLLTSHMHNLTLLDGKKKIDLMVKITLDIIYFQ